MVTVTMGCAIISFIVVTIFDKVIAGLAFPFLTAGLMKLTHALLRQVRPLDDDPQNFAIQESVVVGGLISVAIAYVYSHKLELRELLYGGGAMAILAILSMGLEEFWVAREWRAAAKAKVEAEKARRLGEDGELGVADEMLQEALLTTELAFGSHHPQVATIVTYHAEVMATLGRTAASTLLFKRAVEIHESLRPWTGDFVIALERYAEQLRQNGNLEDALPVASWAVVVSRRVHGEEVPTAHALLGLAKLQAGLGKTAQAYKSCRTAAELLEARLGRQHRDTLKALGLVARHSLGLGRLAEGQRLLAEVVTVRERLGAGETHDADDLDTLLDLARAQAQRNPEQAQQTYSKAVAVFRSEVGPGYERAAELLAGLPAHLARQGPPALAELYTVLCAADAYKARQILRESPHLASLVDSSGWTPLQWASFFGLADVVSLLLTQGADLEFGRDDDYPALYVAARWGRHRAVADIVQKGSEVDLNIICADGSRPMHGAVRSGDHLTLEILISRKARLDVTNARGWTPLHEAAYAGHRKFLVQLISEGVDIDAQVGPSFDTPLHSAVLGNAWLTASTLALNLANFALKNCDGQTPLQLARELGRDSVVAVLEPHVEKTKAKVHGEVFS